MKVRGQTIYTPEERIERLSMPEPNSGCWLWLGATRKSPSGLEYGRLMIGGRAADRRSVSAHRLSYETYRGAIPIGLNVLHKCDTPCCVNPLHLFLGTQKDNVDDMTAKGRRVDHFGEKNGAAKITAEQAATIKALRAQGRMYREIAAAVGVSIHLVKEIGRGRTWRAI